MLICNLDGLYRTKVEKLHLNRTWVLSISVLLVCLYEFLVFSDFFSHILFAVLYIVGGFKTQI